MANAKVGKSNQIFCINSVGCVNYAFPLTPFSLFSQWMRK